MEMLPILSSLRKHIVPAVLIMLEIALACAVLCNAVFMISQRMASIHLSNSIDEEGLSVVTLNGIAPNLAASVIPNNLAALRGLAKVQAVTLMNSMPLTTDAWVLPFSNKPDLTDPVDTSVYYFTQGGEQALGLRLMQGRSFNVGEYESSKFSGDGSSTADVVLVSKSYAERMWPGESALGKRIYRRTKSYEVIGVVDDVLAPDLSVNGPNSMYRSVFFPVGPVAMINYYVIRSAPQDRDRTLSEVQNKLAELNPSAVAKGQLFVDIRSKYFAGVSSMVWMLGLVCIVMLSVTALGIVGLTSFWVRQRRQQIGVRRALGATRRQIRRYFQTENFLLSTAGVMLGMGLAFGINGFLMKHYEMQRMPWYYLPVCAAVLWLLGQLAVLGPALRAAEVPPVDAMRS